VSDLTVVVPSRGRPEQAQALARVFADTCTAGTTLLLALDEDDPTLPGYLGAVQTARIPMGYHLAANTSMVEALNRTTGLLVSPGAVDLPFAIGFMGDDHCPRTHGWDAEYLAALRDLGTGIVYGDDLLQGERLPTQCAMTADIVQALGYMSPPELRHMYVDNFWLHLGRATGCIKYLPDVAVEHLHPFAGKAEMDEGYARVNDHSVYRADEQAFAEYVRTRFAEDVAKVRELRAAHV
jgi:hypothetical protein